MTKLLRPRPRTDPVKWAGNREYPASAGHPGKRNPRKTPYMIPFALAVHGRTHKRVVMVVSAQSGKTESFIDIMGERLDTAPVPTLYVGPSKQFLSEQFEPRLEDLMKNTVLKDRVAPKSQQKKTRKVINGVPLRLAHGGSSTAMKSDPFGLALMDEVDEMMTNIRNQGNPVGLVDARGDSYPDFVNAVTSTPSIGEVAVELDEESGLEFWAEADPNEIKSTIWRLWQSGTRYHWAWPCPHCRDYFIPRFDRLRWDKPKDAEGRELKSTAAMANNTAHLVCPAGCIICEGDPVEGSNLSTKEWMNDNGVYVAPGQRVERDGTIVGPMPESWTLSYWVSGLCSPFVSWGERAARYVEAVRTGTFADVQTVKNAGFGELHAPTSTANLSWKDVQKCALVGHHAGAVHERARVVTLTADVQKERIPYVIRAWGAYGTSWLVEADELYGPTAEKAIWRQLGDLLNDTYDGFPIKLGLVDSGFRPGKKFVVPEHRVYEFAKRYPRLVRATKGSSSPMRKPVQVSKIDIKLDGKEFKQGLDLLRLDVNYFKSWVMDRVSWPRDEGGAWFLTEEISEDYCRQIVSERQVVKPDGKIGWVQRSRENHFLDCEAMQGAAHMFLNLGKLKGEGGRQSPRQQQQQTEPKQSARSPRGGGWLDGGSIW